MKLKAADLQSGSALRLLYALLTLASLAALAGAAKRRAAFLPGVCLLIVLGKPAFRTNVHQLGAGCNARSTPSGSRAMTVR